MSISRGSGSVTQLLSDIRNGNRDSLDELLPLVYAELRGLARQHLSREREDHTLQPTALVHEAYLRLIRQSSAEFENRAHFFGIAARLMREILIDHARGKNRQKRGGGLKTQIVLDAQAETHDESEVDVLAIDEALKDLEKLDPKQAKIVEMKFFAGMTIEEIAAVAEISPATVKREWATAKLFLKRKLKD